jgi:hypothetical protein
VEELREPTLETRVREWLSIYNYTLLANLIVVFCITKEIQPILGAYLQRGIEIPSGIKAYEEEFDLGCCNPCKSSIP